MLLYMAVTSDKYELPLCVSDTIKALSEYSGLSKNNINSCICQNRSGKNRGFKHCKGLSKAYKLDLDVFLRNSTEFSKKNFIIKDFDKLSEKQRIEILKVLLET